MTVIGYVSDVEGNKDYWESYISISEVLSRGVDGGLVLKDGCSFVFGGDAVDKGPGDMAVVKDLLDLKKRYPERVFLLIGNRDANKLRFTSELDDAYWSKHELLEDSGCLCYWVDEAKRVSPKTFLEKDGGTDTRVNRLRWMLKETMGCDTTFEMRRKELAARQSVSGSSAEAVTDEEVLESFLASVRPGDGNAFMLHYLQAAQLAAVVGDVLFVHGAVNEKNMGRVPGVADRVDDVREWAQQLNAWCQAQVAEYANSDGKWLVEPSGGKRGQRAADDLMDYGVPGGNDGKTVVYATFLVNGNPVDLTDEVTTYLNASGVKRMVVGHAPHGECPVVMNSTGKVTVVTADTSYSDMSAANNRGKAVSEVVLREESTQVRGVLADGRAIAYAVPCPGSEPSQCFVGLQLKDQSWIKAKLAEEAEKDHLSCRGEGYKLHKSWISVEEVKQLLP